MGVMPARSIKEDLNYRFRGYFNERGEPNSSCWLRVYELRPGSYLVIASEYGNQGTSVTNCAASLSTQVWVELGSPVGFTFIEHYPPLGGHAENFSIVECAKRDGAFVDPPAWRPIRRAFLEGLLGLSPAALPA